MSSGKPTYDDSEWPILRVTLPSVMTEADFAEHLQTIRDRFLSRQEPHVLIVDSRRCVALDTARGRMVAAERRAFQGDLVRWRLGVALVVRPSPLGPGLGEGLDWFFDDAPYPVKAFATLEHATQWAQDRIRASDRMRSP